jgi:hypothetical protein
MKECDNSKIHISSNFILSVSLLIMFDTLYGTKVTFHCVFNVFPLMLSDLCAILFSVAWSDDCDLLI